MFKNVARCLFPRRVLPLSQSDRDDSTFGNGRYLSLLLFQQPVTGHKRIRSTYSEIPPDGQPLIRTPVNTDNGHFSVSRVTNSQLYIVNPAIPTNTGYSSNFNFLRHNHVLIEEIEPCSKNDRFLWLNTIFYFEKQ